MKEWLRERAKLSRMSSIAYRVKWQISEAI